KKKALLPSSLLSPSRLWLLHAADELVAHLDGKTGAQAAADAVRKIRNTQSTRYGESWFNNVENHMGTIKSYSKQNLDITEDGRIVDNFSAQNFQKLLKEMIPDEATRKTVEMGLEELKKDELILNNTLYGGTYYDNLKVNYKFFLQSLDVEDVKSTKKYAAFSDEEALSIAQSRNKKVQDKYSTDHYRNLVDVSNSFVVENGNVKYADGVKNVKDMIKHSKNAEKTFSAEQFLAMANQGR
ncbi:MAG: hypothetical protein IJF12_00715, partial [Alphaproteobacteria bacterium]|nr:hypothetical protein [Alphaproteobacteria bacterium]